MEEKKSTSKKKNVQESESEKYKSEERDVISLNENAKNSPLASN
jgi:hypothetical protein